jgi:hypothetical protein
MRKRRWITKKTLTRARRSGRRSTGIEEGVSTDVTTRLVCRSTMKGHQTSNL